MKLFQSLRYFSVCCRLFLSVWILAPRVNDLAGLLNKVRFLRFVFYFANLNADTYAKRWLYVNNYLYVLIHSILKTFWKEGKEEQEKSPVQERRPGRPSEWPLWPLAGPILFGRGIVTNSGKILKLHLTLLKRKRLLKYVILLRANYFCK